MASLENFSPEYLISVCEFLMTKNNIEDAVETLVQYIVNACQQNVNKGPPISHQMKIVEKLTKFTKDLRCMKKKVFLTLREKIEKYRKELTEAETSDTDNEEYSSDESGDDELSHSPHEKRHEDKETLTLDSASTDEDLEEDMPEKSAGEVQKINVILSLIQEFITCEEATLPQDPENRKRALSSEPSTSRTGLEATIKLGEELQERDTGSNSSTEPIVTKRQRGKDDDGASISGLYQDGPVYVELCQGIPVLRQPTRLSQVNMELSQGEADSINVQQSSSQDAEAPRKPADCVLSENDHQVLQTSTVQRIPDEVKNLAAPDASEQTQSRPEVQIQTQLREGVQENMQAGNVDLNQRPPSHGETAKDLSYKRQSNQGVPVQTQSAPAQTQSVPVQTKGVPDQTYSPRGVPNQKPPSQGRTVLRKPIEELPYLGQMNRGFPAQTQGVPEQAHTRRGVPNNGPLPQVEAHPRWYVQESSNPVQTQGVPDKTFSRPGVPNHRPQVKAAPKLLPKKLPSQGFPKQTRSRFNSSNYGPPPQDNAVPRQSCQELPCHWQMNQGLPGRMQGVPEQKILHRYVPIFEPVGNGASDPRQSNEERLYQGLMNTGYTVQMQHAPVQMHGVPEQIHSRQWAPYYGPHSQVDAVPRPPYQMNQGRKFVAQGAPQNMHPMQMHNIPHQRSMFQSEIPRQPVQGQMSQDFRYPSQRFPENSNSQHGVPHHKPPPRNETAPNPVFYSLMNQSPRIGNSQAYNHTVDCVPMQTEAVQSIPCQNQMNQEGYTQPTPRSVSIQKPLNQEVRSYGTEVPQIVPQWIQGPIALEPLCMSRLVQQLFGNIPAMAESSQPDQVQQQVSQKSVSSHTEVPDNCSTAAPTTVPVNKESPQAVPVDLELRSATSVVQPQSSQEKTTARVNLSPQCVQPLSDKEDEDIASDDEDIASDDEDD